MLHNDWQDMTLGDCLTVKHGKNQKEVESIHGTYPILGTGGQIGRTDSYLYDKPSVLIGRKGTIDKPRYMDTPFWTVDTLFYTDIKNNAVAKYIYYFFTTINWYQYNEASGVPSLSASTISSIKLKLPPKADQQRIVAILDVWEQYLNRFDSEIEIKRNIKKGLMQKLITSNVRLSGYLDAWEDVIIKDICNVKRGGSPRPIEQFITSSPDGLNWLRIGDIKPGSRYIISTSQKIKPEGLRKTTQVHPGDFILSNSMSFGRPYIMKISACIHDGWLALMNINDRVNKAFLFYMLSSEYMQSKFSALSAGSGVQNLKKETVEGMTIKLPSKSEQDDIAVLLTDMDEQLEMLVKKRSAILAQKKYLIHNLVTGKIRIDDLEDKVSKELQYA